MKYLLISHGHLASGMKSALEVILGKNEKIIAIDMYVDGKTFEEKLNEAMKTVGLQEELIVITDVYGGSVNQKVVSHFGVDNNYIISGMNLPMLLELIGTNATDLNVIKKIISESREQIVYVNSLLESTIEEDEFGFIE
ncbi:PTS sugar transporter subunit IIA [Allofustis seminis]|uniref:PTS sugar transporter subunit IIA n=1 Tax=Allofustis seminis TaxID=166939 RepID=UPI000379F46D|nr:PTS sugar transporter subunit IIA [Allofustis seminis]